MDSGGDSSLDGKTLLTIPLELRLMIFTLLFQSTTVHHSTARPESSDTEETNSEAGSESAEEDDQVSSDTESDTELKYGAVSDAHSEASVPWDATTEKVNPRNTAILLTCRKIYHEAVPLLAANVLLKLSSTGTMLTTLTSLSRTQLEAIRHIRVKSCPFYLPWPGWQFKAKVFEPFRILPMFPGLQLDVLIVEDCHHDVLGWRREGKEKQRPYDWAGGLIHSEGWKELRFITPTTEFMIFDERGPGGSRFKQPDEWDYSLRYHHPDSGVKMYIAKEESSKPGSGFSEDAKSREEWNVVIGDVTPERYKREVMIVGKRAAGVKYVQEGKSVCEFKHFAKFLEHTSWAEIREKSIFESCEWDAEPSL